MSPAAPQPVTLEDEELYCPVCNYNLTGNHRGRCPECGALFDRQALIAAQKSHAITLIPWDDPAEMPWHVRLLGTLRICLFKAERFAFAFSVQPRKSRALGFHIGTTCASAAVVVLLWLLSAGLAALTGRSASGVDPSGDEFLVVCGILGLVALLTSPASTLCAGIVLWWMYPHYDGRHRLRPWLSIAAYASAHFLLMAAGFPLLLVCGLLAIVSTVEFGDNFFLVCMLFTTFGWLACAMLCAFTLQAVVEHRSPQAGRVRGALWILGAVYVISPIVTAFCLAWLAVTIVSWLGW